MREKKFLIKHFELKNVHDKWKVHKMRTNLIVLAIVHMREVVNFFRS